MHKRVDVEAKRRQLPRRKVEIDHLVLRTEHLDFAETWQVRDPGSDLLDVIAKLPEGEPIGGEGVNVPIDIAELVVEIRAAHAGRQHILDVLHMLAHLIELPRDVRRFGGVLQIDENRSLARCRIALGVIEAIDLLQLFLDGVRDLVDGLFHGGAWPLLLDNHRLDREGRVLFAAELLVGHGAGGNRNDHEKPDKGAVLDRPLGEIERPHADGPWRRRTG